MEDSGLAIAQEKVDTRNRLQEFMKTDAYKEFIEDGFMNDEVVRISEALTEDAMQDDIDQRLLHQKFVAPAHLKQYFLTIYQFGNTAEQQIAERLEEQIEETIDETKVLEVDPITGEEFLVDTGDK